MLVAATDLERAGRQALNGAVERAGTSSPRTCR